MHDRHTTGSSATTADRVKSILASRKLTLYQASIKSANIFGRSSPYRLPHNFYYDLRRPGFSPSLSQIFALSRISNYDAMDWLRICGFNIDAIPRLQIQFISSRTILLDSSLDDPNVSIAWLSNLGSGGSPKGVKPLSQFLEWTRPVRVRSLAEIYGRGFIYAKIGEQDAFAFPELLAGSIVRIRPRKRDETLTEETKTGKRLVLVEHDKGFCCCRIRFTAKDRFALVTPQLPDREVIFKVPDEATIVGVVDLEIRSVIRPRQPAISNEFTSRWRPEPLSSEPSQLGPLLRHARRRMGLSFRTASALTRQIAGELHDPRYFIAASSLSDYETVETPPRHFHKLITFSVIYALGLRRILDTLGLGREDNRFDPIPDALMGRPPTGLGSTAELREIKQNGFLSELITEIEEIPLFLRGSADVVCGLSRPSLKDFFWIGPLERGAHPYLDGAIIAVVNRQKKKPNDCRSKPFWQQPLYVVLKRDGNYMCGCCRREDNTLVVYSYPGGVHRHETFRDRNVEIIGKIAELIRKL